MTAGGFRYTIRPDQHTVICGRNGTGKTTLGRILIQGYRTFVVVDPKRRFELAGVPVVAGLDGFRQAWPQKVRRVVARPSEAEVGDPEGLWAWADGVFVRVLSYGRTAVLVDECLDLATATRIVPGYRRALRQGREPLVPVFSCTQRPSGCHNDVFSESVHLFVFDLNLEGDRRKVAGIGGDELMTRADERFPQEHGFAYHGPETSGGVVWCPPLSVPAGQLPPAPYPSPGPVPGSGG